jgi:hypothetical protein
MDGAVSPTDYLDYNGCKNGIDNETAQTPDFISELSAPNLFPSKEKL